MVQDVKPVSAEPTREQIDAGAQRLASFGDDSVWPDSWSPLQVAAMRNDAERVWRSMWLAAPAPPADPRDGETERLRDALHVAECLQDSAYLDGAKAGWNAAQSDNPHEVMAAIRSSRAGYLKELRQPRQALRGDSQKESGDE